jgi:hypothetical protein
MNEETRILMLERENARLRSELARIRARRRRGPARLARLAALILLAVGVVAGAGPPQSQSWKGMILAQPARSRLTFEQRELGLRDYDTVSILIENLPDAIKGSVTRDDLDAWTRNRLKYAGLSVVSSDDRHRSMASRFPTTDEDELRRADLYMSYIYVNVNALRSAAGLTVCNVLIECNRGVFVHPGHFKPATVWRRSTLLLFGSALDAKAQIRKALNQLLDEFERDWKKCNPNRR